MSGGHGMERARRLMGLPHSWIESTGPERYGLRTGPDRRARIMMSLDEAGFRALIEEPGLAVRAAGGWTARRRALPSPAAPPGRPGVIEGERTVMEADGQVTRRPANLALTAVAWLARRLDEDGRPWLGKAEVAAAEQLGRDAEVALCAPGLTLRWDALPRAGAGGRGRSDGPTGTALAAARRVERALSACGRDRALVKAICIDATALQAAEQTLGLRRRTGKLFLKQGLTALARHYRLV